jgi:uncharacterized MAPEG superfamily protein
MPTPPSSPAKTTTSPSLSPPLPSPLLTLRRYRVTDIYHSPRKTLTHIQKDTSLPKPILRRIQRGEAACANGLETIGIYAAGVVAANVAGVPKDTLNVMTLGYVASRVVYNWVYVFAQDNSRVAPLRSLVWLVGVGLLTGLWVKAGNGLNV